jgi:hypothetical protein
LLIVFALAGDSTITRVLRLPVCAADFFVAIVVK